ncbi:MAG: glycosyltransferase family 4 protein [Planctomycetaceae bacterium]|nr:glycosyltransferase family 4 protein [Planctomycetaceae bacterium]
MKRKAVHVCFITDGWIRGRAGTEMQLRLLLNHLDRDRIHPFLVFLKKIRASREYVPSEVPVLYLDCPNNLFVSFLTKSFKFRSFLKENRIDLIQAYFPDSTFFASIIGKLCGVPVVFGARRDIGHWMRPRDKRVAKFLNQFFIDKIVANAQACKEAVIEQENAKPENVFVIPNGIETERFDSIPNWISESANTPLRIGAVGNTKPVKGTDVLIDAAKIVLEKFPDAQFEIAGGNSESHKPYNKQIADCGIAEHFHLLGSLADIPKFLQTLDIAVLPSRAEGLSNGLLEYMAAGRPSIATDVGGNGELIEHERNGLLVPSENPQALADAIINLIENPQRAAKFAAEARNDVTDKYNAAKVANQFCDLCETVLKQKVKK